MPDLPTQKRVTLLFLRWLWYIKIRHSCQGRSGGYGDATLAQRVLYLNNFIHKSFAEDNIFGNHDIRSQKARCRLPQIKR